MNNDAAILLIEDNEDDIYFAQRAFAKVAPHETLAVVTDGQAALDYLQGVGPYAGRVAHPLPRIVFLDLKLPFVPGLEVLAEIRRDPKLRNLRVVVMTSSAQDSDRTRAEELGAQGYLVKPAPAEVLRRALEAATSLCPNLA